MTNFAKMTDAAFDAAREADFYSPAPRMTAAQWAAADLARNTDRWNDFHGVDPLDIDQDAKTHRAAEQWVDMCLTGRGA
jgi:hypothetical protein